MTEEEAELERRQARDLQRAIENRKAQQQEEKSSSYEEHENYGAYEEERREEEEEENAGSLRKREKQFVKRVAKEVAGAGSRGAARAKNRAVAAKRVVWYPSRATALLFRLALGGILTAIVCMSTYEYFFGWGPSRSVYSDGTHKVLPPGSKAGSWGVPYLGETIDYYRDPFKFTLRHVRKYGPVSYSNVLGEHTVLLSGSKALGQLFYNASLVQRREALPPHIAALLGRDILPALDNSRHAEVRAVITHAINTRGVIQAHLSNIERVMNRHMAKWTRQPAPFDLLGDIKDMSAAMASVLFFTNDESHHLAPLLAHVLDALSAYPSSLSPTYRRGLRAKEQLIEWYKRAVMDHLHEIDLGSNKYNGDVLDLILKLSHKIPDITPRHLAHELHYMVLSTYELYNPISAVLVALEQYPGWLPLLREEVEAMNLDPSYPALPFDKLHRDDLLSLLINETRRFYPSTVAEWGKAKLLFDAGDYIVPEGFTIMACVAATHMDPEDFRDPEVFDPTRFVEDETKNEYAFVPQGGGPRDSPTSHRCVGEDLSYYTVKLFLMNLLARYEWSLAAVQNVNFDTSHYLPEPHSLRASSFSNATSPVS
jgi:cytochrome P450